MKSKRNFFNILRWPTFLVIILITCSSHHFDKVQNEVEAVVSFDKETVLFVGNSHTYFNDGVDKHLRGFLEQSSLPYAPIVEKIVVGGYTLEDHWSDPATLAKLAERQWDVVVLQENSSRAANEKVEARAGIRNLSAKIKDEKTQIYLFMTWAYRDQPEMINSIQETYESIAPLVGGANVPVGLLFDSIVKEKVDGIDLYNADGVHPSLEGTFLTAALFYTAIYNLDPIQSAYTSSLDTATADYLKEKAQQFYTDYKN
ncbi:MAG: SGNH/GDSL hydrolase family protein [Aurantibacter sp.]